MNKIKNSSMFLLWAGAAISIAEIVVSAILGEVDIRKAPGNLNYIIRNASKI